MPIRIFTEFSQCKDFDELKRFISAWARQVVSEVNNVITPNVAENSSSITTINNSITTINETLESGYFNGNTLVVSNSNTTNTISIVRGVVAGATGATLSGEGFGGANLGVGLYRVTYDTVFTDTPAFVANTVGVTQGYIVISSQSNSQIDFETRTMAGVLTDALSINFISIGILA